MVVVALSLFALVALCAIRMGRPFKGRFKAGDLLEAELVIPTDDRRVRDDEDSWSSIEPPGERDNPSPK